MPKKKSGYVIVEAVVSIPRAGEFKVGIPIAVDQFLDPPTVEQLETVVHDEVQDRLRVKLVKGEYKRFRKVV